MSILFYHRPAHIPKEYGPLNLPDCQKYVERAACTHAQIPENLSFENVIEGKTMPPCSLEDFLDYLVYVAHDAENLQFYLWLLDYTKRFNNLSEAERSLSPIWRAGKAHHLLHQSGTGQGVENEGYSPLPKLKMGAFFAEAEEAPSRQSEDVPLPENTIATQPFRQEISLITSHYIRPSSPRELNLSYRDRAAILHALQYTTHPSAFRPLTHILTLTLRHQAHPNFIRWTLCNGNRPRVFFLRSLAIFWLFLSFLVSLLLTLSHKSRYARIGAAPLLWLGTVSIIAAHNGLCILLYRRHRREIHPWEIDADDDRTTLSSTSMENVLGKTSTEVRDMELGDKRTSSVTEKRAPLGPQNAFGQEAWVARWARRPAWRKLALRKVWVQEDGLRILQSQVVKKAHGWAVLVTVPIIVGVVALPVGGFY